MSLLLDALKKSEAQRRRGQPPAVDLAATPPSARSGRSGWRWPLFVVPVLLLAALVSWLGPEIASRLGGGMAAEDRAARDAVDAAPELQAAGPSLANSAPGHQESASAQPAPVAGARRARRQKVGRGSGDDAARAAPPASATQVEPESGLEPPGDAVAIESAQPDPEPESDPRDNFIRPWELPQAQRGEFPDLNLTVHFFSDQPDDRFVLFDGERFSEGEQVAPGVRLIEIRRQGVIVDFADYRVLIE